MPGPVENAEQLILDHAREVLLAGGYRRFSMRRVARASGLALGTLYNYYPTKRALMGRLMADYWDRFFAENVALGAAGAGIHDQLRTLYVRLGEFVALFEASWLEAEDRPAKTGWRRSPTEQAYIQRLYDTVAELLARDALRTGRRPSADLEQVLPRFLVLSLMTAVQTGELSFDEWERVIRCLLD